VIHVYAKVIQLLHIYQFLLLLLFLNYIVGVKTSLGDRPANGYGAVD
jgi:hypothetical protein